MSTSRRQPARSALMSGADRQVRTHGRAVPGITGCARRFTEQPARAASVFVFDTAGRREEMPDAAPSAAAHAAPRHRRPDLTAFDTPCRVVSFNIHHEMADGNIFREMAARSFAGLPTNAIYSRRLTPLFSIITS